MQEAARQKALMVVNELRCMKLSAAAKKGRRRHRGNFNIYGFSIAALDKASDQQYTWKTKLWNQAAYQSCWNIPWWAKRPDAGMRPAASCSRHWVGNPNATWIWIIFMNWIWNLSISRLGNCLLPNGWNCFCEKILTLSFWKSRCYKSSQIISELGRNFTWLSLIFYYVSDILPAFSKQTYLIIGFIVCLLLSILCLIFAFTRKHFQ